MNSPSFYVYYRVADPESAAARACARALLAEIRERTGVAGRLMRRSDDVATWMEVYEGAIPVGFASELERAAVASGIGAHLAAGARRVVERFEAL